MIQLLDLNAHFRKLVEYGTHGSKERTVPLNPMENSPLLSVDYVK